MLVSSYEPRLKAFRSTVKIIRQAPGACLCLKKKDI